MIVSRHTNARRAFCVRLGAVVALALASPMVPASRAGAEGLVGGTVTRAEIFARQTRLLDRRQARGDPSSQGHQLSGLSRTSPPYRGRYRGRYYTMARAAAERHHVPADMFARLVQQESGWDKDAVSAKGAVGLAQLTPETAAHLGVDATDPRDNLDGGARYLRALHDRFGSWKLALAAYNAGPKAVVRYKGVPPYRETKAYVRAILGR